MQVAAKPHRHRATPSDPFNDSHTPSYSAYGVPTLTRNAPPQAASHRAPPPPPKSLPKSTSIRRAQPAVPMSMSRDNNVVEAVRDAVQVRSGDRSPRTRMGRSNTEVPAYVVELLSHRVDSNGTAPILLSTSSCPPIVQRDHRLVPLVALTPKTRESRRRAAMPTRTRMARALVRRQRKDPPMPMSLIGLISLVLVLVRLLSPGR